MGKAGRQGRRQEKTRPQRQTRHQKRWETSWVTRAETKRSPDRMGQTRRQDRRQEKDKTSEADTASETRWDKLGDKAGGKRKTSPARRTRHDRETSWGTRPETRERQDQRGVHSIPEQMGDKLADKTGDKRKTRPARRTQHPSQGRQIKKALRAPTVDCLGKAFGWILMKYSLVGRPSRQSIFRDVRMIFNHCSENKTGLMQMEERKNDQQSKQPKHQQKYCYT